MIGVIVALSLGLVAGWIVGGVSRETSDPSLTHERSPDPNTSILEDQLEDDMVVTDYKSQLRQIVQWSSFTSAPRLLSILDELDRRVQFRPLRALAREVLLDRLAVLDPMAGLSDPKIVARAMDLLLRGIVGDELDAKIEELLRSTDRNNDVLKACALKLVEADIEKALSLVERHATGAERDKRTLYTTVLTKWSETDPENAMERIKGISLPFYDLSSIYRDVFESWLADSFEDAVDWITRTPNAASERGLISALYKSWPDKDPQAAASFLASMPAGWSRDRYSRDVFTRWAKNDRDMALEWIQNNAKTEASLGHMIGYLAASEDSLEGALGYLENMSENSEGIRSMLVEIGTQFIKKDPDAFLSLNEDWVPEVLESIIAKRTRQSIAPDLLLKHFDMLNDAGAFKDQRGVLSMFHSLATDDLPASRELLAKLSSEAEEAALAGLARGLAKSDPGLTSEILASFPPGDSRVSATQHLVASWASRDPTAAADWVSALDEGDERAYAVQNLVNNWTRFDIASAESWLNGLPPSASRDRGTSALVDRLRYIDPESAFEWVKSIEDSKARSRAMTALSETWNHSDPAGVEKAVSELRQLGLD